MHGSRTSALRRHGTASVDPVFKTHRLNGLCFAWQNGAIRYISIDGVEVVRGLSVVIRDANWGTHDLVPVAEETTTGDTSIAFDYHARLALDDEGSDKPCLNVQMTVQIDPAGLDARLRLTTDRRFETCRSGLVMLLPLAGIAGHEVDITHTDGTRESGRFPGQISPAQPFFDIRRMAFAARDHAPVEIAFDGDVFEMEDQRNWSDASFKIYNRPLARPSPYIIEAGEIVEQHVRIRLADEGAQP